MSEMVSAVTTKRAHCLPIRDKRQGTRSAATVMSDIDVSNLRPDEGTESGANSAEAMRRK